LTLRVSVTPRDRSRKVFLKTREPKVSAMNEARIRIKADLLTFDNRRDPGAIAFTGFASRFLDLLAGA
jgi:hypothetical protein